MDYNTIVKAGQTKRYHSDYMINRQDVAQHSFQCALLINNIADILNVNLNRPDVVDSSKMVLHMLVHDAPEQYTGDVPGYIKNSNAAVRLAFEKLEYEFVGQEFSFSEAEAFNGLSELEAMICSFVDSYDCGRTSIRECMMGNRGSMDEVVFHVYHGCEHKVARIFDHLRDEFGTNPNFSARVFKTLLEEYQSEAGIAGVSL